MHEETLLNDLRRRLTELGEHHAKERITGVSLWVGALSHVSERQLRSRWPDVVRSTAAEQATLRVVVSSDVTDPRARGIVLSDVTLDDREAAR